MDAIIKLLTRTVCIFAICQTVYGQAAPLRSTDTYLVHITDPHTQTLRLYRNTEKGTLLGSFQALSQWLQTQQKTLTFAMNGGMFTSQYAPVGLYIEQSKILHPMDTVSKGYGNFYMQPNGIFYLTSTQEAGVCTRPAFNGKKNVTFATQSGPMLLVDGRIHPAFTQGSSNVNIRNGVGILPGGKVLFVLSKKAVNFYDFASFFKKAGCTQALYLDGVVSRAYAPAQQWIQTDGTFGVLIAETAPLPKVTSQHK